MGKKLFSGLVFLFCPIFLLAQAISPVTPKRATITAGGYFSFGQTDYGQRHAFGPGAYADFDYRVWRNIGVGVEGEVRFLNFLTDSSSGAGICEQNFLGDSNSCGMADYCFERNVFAADISRIGRNTHSHVLLF